MRTAKLDPSVAAGGTVTDRRITCPLGPLWHLSGTVMVLAACRVGGEAQPGCDGARTTACRHALWPPPITKHGLTRRRAG